MRPAWHALLLLAVSCVCFAKTYMFDMRGKNLKITIPSNPSTGYTWRLNYYNPNYFKFIGKEYIQPKSILVGSPGQESFTFTYLPQKVSANPSGSQHTQIILHYARGEEQQKVDEMTVLLTLYDYNAKQNLDQDAPQKLEQKAPQKLDQNAPQKLDRKKEIRSF